MRKPFVLIIAIYIMAYSNYDVLAMTHQLKADSLYILKNNSLLLTIDSSIGARVTSFKFENHEILSTNETHPTFYGSSLWLSPQGKWGGQGILDRAAYNVENFTENELLINSKIDTARGFQFKKHFISNPVDTSFIIQYTIINTSDSAQKVAAWENTRVESGGLAFFPKGNHPPLPKSDLNIKERNNFIWYPFDKELKKYQKIFMNGGEGWQAHVQNRILFIKEFPKIEPENAAPGEENVEIYVNSDNT